LVYCISDQTMHDSVFSVLTAFKIKVFEFLSFGMLYMIKKAFHPYSKRLQNLGLWPLNPCLLSERPPHFVFSYNKQGVWKPILIQKSRKVYHLLHFEILKDFSYNNMFTFSIGFTLQHTMSWRNVTCALV
jgi:hypothetical protein